MKNKQRITKIDLLKKNAIILCMGFSLIYSTPIFSESVEVHTTTKNLMALPSKNNIIIGTFSDYVNSFTFDAKAPVVDTQKKTILPLCSRK